MTKKRKIRKHSKRKRYWILPDEVRKQIIALAAGGATYNSILAELDVSRGTITNVLKPLGGVIRPEHYRPSQARLSLEDRFEIRLGLELGESYRVIAARIHRHASTVCREVAANGGRVAYRPAQAHRRAGRLAQRPKATKLASSPRLRTAVVEGLQRCWSPEQISHLLAVAYPDDQEMRVSHETIYRSIYVQGRGELRRELARCLRTGRAKRKPRGRIDRRGTLPDMVLISERPAEVGDRAAPGHWEGDLILGQDGKSAIGTLVERTTRYLMLLHLPGDRSAATVRDAMTEAIQRLPAALRRSLTWDRGVEMAEHVRFSVDTGVQVYFCDPYSPWQRGSNENTNGLLRQFFPKGTDLSVHDRARLDEVEDLMNTRPRKTLGWDDPAKRFAELVASTD